MAFNFEMRAATSFLAWAWVVAHQLEHQPNDLEFAEVVGLNPASCWPFFHLFLSFSNFHP